jgi:hypothetical protein
MIYLIGSSICIIGVNEVNVTSKTFVLTKKNDLFDWLRRVTTLKNL